MRPTEILQADVPGKPQNMPITSFLPAFQTRIKETSRLKPGQTTDDWECTKLVTESIIACGGYNHDDMARRHVTALQQNPIGWGKGSSKTIGDISRWYRTGGIIGRNPNLPLPKPKPNTGAGNGVAMKAAAIALFHGARLADPRKAIRNDIRRLASLTHADPRAWLCAYAHALAIWYTARRHVNSLNEARCILLAIIKDVQAEERSYPVSDGDMTSDQLQKLFHLLGDTKAIYKEIGPGFIATESVIYALGIFLSIPTSFESALLTAVNAGGDSDTTASMIGTLLGVNCGLTKIPHEWWAFQDNYFDPIHLGIQLYNVARATMPS